eukprot:m.210818 g.210818  ORF g.210818 m.210818 type:complete len:284 (-) comp16940_c1_seq2:5390-6241(-)
MWGEVLCWLSFGGFVALLAAVLSMKLSLPKKEIKDSPKSGHPEDKLTLYTLPTKGKFKFSASAFCAKLHLFLVMSGLTFDVKEADFRKAPKGKAPYVQHGQTLIGDSGFIVQYLINTYTRPNQRFLGRLRISLTPLELSIGRTVQALCENNLYNFCLWSRWIVDETNSVKRDMFDSIPFPFRDILFHMIQRGMYDWLWGQGFIRHSKNDLIEMCKRDLDAIEVLLGDKRFLFGDDPTIFDCTLFGILDCFINSNSPILGLCAYATSKPRLVQYVDRIRQLCPN